VAKEADHLGYAALRARERLVYPIEDIRFPRSSTAGPLDEYYIETFEPMETLAFVAAHTERIKLGTSILPTPFYSPLALARRFATLDQLS
jgi:alkanesulfonate monooxygenase SsuD/methylene tetrahydromethanopterin reductase-like flavin-dependent oxidoreductase (luciferase family)